MAKERKQQRQQQYIAIGYRIEEVVRL